MDNYKSQMNGVQGFEKAIINNLKKLVGKDNMVVVGDEITISNERQSCKPISLSMQVGGLTVDDLVEKF